MKKKGFTLIELLAVIVILAIIALIAVPVIMNIISGVRKQAFENTAHGLIKAGEMYYAASLLGGGMDEDKKFILPNNEKELSVKGDVPKGQLLVTKDGKISVAIINGEYCAKKNVGETSVEVTKDLASCWVFVPSIEELKDRYSFVYYSSINNAITDVNNNEIGENADTEEAEAEAGIYIDEAENISVVLLKDTIIEGEKIVPSTDMTINLGGKSIIFNHYIGIDGGKNRKDTITIDGRLTGSAVIMNGVDGGGNLIQTRTNNFIINGGTYKLEETTINETYFPVGIKINAGGTATILDSDIIVSATSPTSTFGVFNSGDAIINDSNILVKATNSKTYGIYNEKTMIATNNEIKSYANYYNENDVWLSLSQGIANASTGNLKVNNCYVMGTHSGIQSEGTISVNGGIYESFGHGGIYFVGSGTTSYVNNSTFQGCEMPEGYITNTSSNEAGVYIGGSAESNNITVYMDNNKIYGLQSPIVLRGTSGEQNNTLYISNSKINLNASNKIRIDNDTHKLYIGSGCNFGADNTTNPSAVIVTEEIYTKE